MRSPRKGVVDMKKKPVVKKEKPKKPTVEVLVKQALKEVACNRAYLETKIEDSRVDAREHLQSVKNGLDHQIQKLQQGQESLGRRMDSLEVEIYRVRRAVNGAKEELWLAIRVGNNDLHENLKSMETGLSEKIEAIGSRVENPNERISSLEATS